MSQSKAAPFSRQDILGATDDLAERGANAKRYKPAPFFQAQPVIDLTNDSDEFEEVSDTADSSDEDDVMITGVRDVSRPNTNNIQSTPARRLPGLENNHVQLANAPESITGYQPTVEALDSPVSAPFNGAPSFSSPSFTPSLNQTREQMVDYNENLLVNKGVRVDGITFRSVNDVIKREELLKKDVAHRKKEMKNFEEESKKRAGSLTDILTSIEKLKLLKVPETSSEFKNLLDSRAELLTRARNDAKTRQIFHARVKYGTTELLNFINQAKPKIISTINNLRRQEAIEGQRRAEERRVEAIRRQFPRPQHQEELKQLKQNHPLFKDMLQSLTPNHHTLTIDDDDDDEEEEEEYGGGGGEGFDSFGYLMRDMGQSHWTNRYDPDLQNVNIYNSGTTEDLRTFLESVKTIEDSIEGESNTPADLTVNLLKHQRLGLHWLELNEKDEKKKGGILADAMGLGKTVQAISLMLSRRSEDDEMKTNLIVCPVAMIRQWESEIQTKVKESANIRTYIYSSTSGSKSRLQSFRQLAKYDVVFVSFQTLASEMKKHVHGFSLAEMGIRRINEKKAENSYISPFFAKEAKFYRTILDEAHIIKNKNTKGSVACSIIESEYRWCLSGTPMQNNIEEIFPLIRFLRIRPYCFENRFRSDISIPLKSKTGNYDEMDKQKSMSRVRIMLKAIMLKRSKDSMIDGKPILTLPEKSVLKENIQMEDNDLENTFYKHLEGKSAVEVERLLKKGLAKGNYSSILTLLLRLRQACLHSELVRIGERKQGYTFDDEGNVKKKISWESMFQYATDLKPEVVNRINSSSAQEEIETNEEEDNSFTCPICHDPIPNQDWTIFYPCGHGLCKECVDNFFEQFQENEANGIKVAKCLMCRLQVKETEMITFPIFDNVCNKKLSMSAVGLLHERDQKNLANLNLKIGEEIKELNLSPKMSKALSLIKGILSSNKSDKIILFSTFTGFFDLFEKILAKEHISSLRYDGSMSGDTRNNVIKEFYKSETSNLLLISLKAGNVGLTLTCANHVIMMDPFWNPYVEEQAQDRAHRIGQQKPVTVYRLLANNTVEDRILELQEKKKLLVESAMDEQGIKNIGGLGRNEIEYLFNLRDRP